MLKMLEDSISAIAEPEQDLQMCFSCHGGASGQFVDTSPCCVSGSYQYVSVAAGS